MEESDSEGEESSNSSFNEIAELFSSLDVIDEPQVTSTTSSSEAHAPTVHKEDLEHIKCSLKTHGIDKDQLEASIKHILQYLDDDILKFVRGLKDALTNCVVRINMSKRPDQPEPRLNKASPGRAVLENRIKELQPRFRRDVVLEDDYTPSIAKKIFCECADPCTNNCYSTMINEAYHEEQDKLLDITQLGLDGCRSEHGGNLWMVTKKEWDDINFVDLAHLILEKGEKKFKKEVKLQPTCKANGNISKITIKRDKKVEASPLDFMDLIYNKVVKLIWSKRDEIKLAQVEDRESIEWLNDVEKILQSICILRIENQWVISNDLSDQQAIINYRDHLNLIVVFMTALVVVLSVKRYAKIAVTQRLLFRTTTN